MAGNRPHGDPSGTSRTRHGTPVGCAAGPGATISHQPRRGRRQLVSRVQVVETIPLRWLQLATGSGVPSPHECSQAPVPRVPVTREWTGRSTRERAGDSAALWVGGEGTCEASDVTLTWRARTSTAAVGWPGREGSRLR